MCVVYMFMCACVHVCGDQMLTLVCSLTALHLYIEAGSLTLTWSSFSLASQLAPGILCFPSAGVTGRLKPPPDTYMGIREVLYLR